MNKILYKNYTFDDQGIGEGKVIEGSFFVENSLAEDELSIDTLRFSVRYPLTGEADTALTNYNYGTPCTYYQNDKLFGKFYLIKVERTARFLYDFSFQSAIGLLDDTTHYGGIYNGQFAADVIADIIGEKIPYTIKPVFSKIKLYGWLPIATRRANLQQVLFACGGCVRKNESGDVFISTLDTTTPIDIPPSRVFDGGKISYDTPVSRVEVKEHGYIALEDTEIKTIFSGELSGKNFITPKGHAVRNASLVTWEEPYHSIEFAGCTLLNDEVGVNYAVVTATPGAEIKGKPYIHTENIIYKEKANYQGEEKIATVDEATLVSLANSASTAERMMAYYGNANTLSTSIILDEEKPTNTVTLPDPFGDSATGLIKNIDGTFGSKIGRGDVEVVLNYVPPTVVGSRTLVSIAVTTPPSQTSYATGDYFNPAGMVVTATYDDNSTAILNSYQITPSEPLLETDTQITITYTELGVTRSTTQAISVITMLRRIAITTPPDITAYYAEDVFNPAGMVITAYYSDGSSRVLSNSEYSYFPTGELTEQDETITITFTDTGVTCNAYQDITVGQAPNLVSIAITTPPNKVSYKLGSFFDTTGMVVTAYFDNDTSKPVSGYTYTPTGALQQSDNKIVVSYTRGEVTATAEQPITVVYLTSIAITTPPTYTSYYEGDKFNKYGMVVTATYSDGSTAALADADYTVSPDTLVDATTQVVISYTEQGITKTAIQLVDVTYYPYDYTKSIVIPTSGTYHLSDFGATHRNIRVVAISGGKGGTGGMSGSSGGRSNSSIIQYGQTGSRSSQPGSYGYGGIGGGEVEGGMFYGLDITLDNDSQDIVINVGAGGAGGAVAGYNYDGILNEGQPGGETTCTIGNATVTSGSGSSNPNGYTDIFTQQTYALKGAAGFGASNGGSGGSSGGDGSRGGDFENMAGGYADRGRQTSTPVTKIEQSGPTISQSWSSKSTYISGGDTTQSVQGWTSYTVNSSTGKITTSGRLLTLAYTGPHPDIPKFPDDDNKNLKYYQQGIVYTNVTNDTVPSSRPNGTYTSTVEEYQTTTSNRLVSGRYYSNANHTGTTRRKLTVSRVYVYKEHTCDVTEGYGGGGGGGASHGFPGNDAVNGRGGYGAKAETPIAPTIYGSSGNSGSGGGGGGGAGGTYAAISGDNKYCNQSASVDGQIGGNGGAGSAGTDGAPGCVIIYFS